MNNKHVWTCENGQDYYPSRAVIERIPEGFYETKYSAEYGSYFSKINSNLDTPINVMSKVYNLIKKDFDKFWSMESKYKSSGIEFRRAVLLHGQPGNGKKYITRRLGEYFVEKMKGLVIHVDDPEDAKKAIYHLRKVEGEDRKVLIIMEDFGIALEKYGLSAIASFLKSSTNNDGVYIIGTTNFEEKVADYISDKPRMISVKFLVDYPDSSERTRYINEFAKKLNIKINSKKVSKDTDKLSLGYIRNLLESHFIYEYDYEETLENIKEMKDNIQSAYYSDSDNTKNIGFD